MEEFSSVVDKLRAERLEERRLERIAKRRREFLEELQERKEQEGTMVLCVCVCTRWLHSPL